MAQAEEAVLTGRLGKAIRLYRKEAGLTQAALALLTGVPTGRLCRIEKGLDNITIKTLSKFAHAFHVTASSMLLRAEATSACAQDPGAGHH